MLHGDRSAFSHCDRAVGNESATEAWDPAFNGKFAQLSKRIMDILLTLMAAPILVPFAVIVSGLILVTVGGPVFFVHKRVGKNGKEFGCIKFRTMKVDAEDALRRYLAKNPSAMQEWKKTQKLQNDPRTIPGIGNALRRTSLDELPQFYNVIRGEMSLVGPRPVTLEELSRYGKDAKYYTAVRPGITGKWQVSGRTGIDYDERVRMDVEYVKSRSILGDLLVLLKTVVVVLRRDGAV